MKARRPRFAGPTPDEIISRKMIHGFQQVTFSVDSDERNRWFNAARKEGRTVFDWLQVIVRRALSRPGRQQAQPVEVPASDLNTMTFFLPDDEFDAAESKARECGMGLRQWLYSTFKAAAYGRPHGKGGGARP